LAGECAALQYRSPRGPAQFAPIKIKYLIFKQDLYVVPRKAEPVSRNNQVRLTDKSSAGQSLLGRAGGIVWQFKDF
jgi:hypothetical protein